MHSFVKTVFVILLACFFIGCKNTNDIKIRNTINSINLSEYKEGGINHTRLTILLDLLKKLSVNQIEQAPVVYYAYVIKRPNNEYGFYTFWIAKDSDIVDEIMLKSSDTERLSLPICDIDKDENRKKSEKFVSFLAGYVWDSNTYPQFLESKPCYIALLKDGNIVSQKDFKVLFATQGEPAPIP